jgi:hypothetical protein
MERGARLLRHLISKTSSDARIFKCPVDTIPCEQGTLNTSGVTLHPLKSERVTEIVKGVTLNLAFNHSAKEARKTPSLIFGLPSNKLRHERRGSLTDRASVTIEGDLSDRLTREFEGEGDLISTERISQINFSIRVKQNPFETRTLVMIQD